MKTLKDIATIRSGFPFRERPVRVESGGCRLVQMRDIDQRLGAIKVDLETVAAPGNWEQHRLRNGDILLAARGQINGAAVFAFSDLTNVIAASTLLVLRSNDEIINPFYLVWHLNLPQTQAELRTMQSGSSIPFLPIEDLGQLPISIPSLEKQRKIVDLELLSQEEQFLMSLLLDKRKELVQGIQKTFLTNS